MKKYLVTIGIIVFSYIWVSVIELDTDVKNWNKIWRGMWINLIVIGNFIYYLVFKNEKK